jgi:hypothetical protein
MTIRKVYKRLSDCMWTFLAASLEKLITKDPLGRPMRLDNCEERRCQWT